MRVTSREWTRVAVDRSESPPRTGHCSGGNGIIHPRNIRCVGRDATNGEFACRRQLSFCTVWLPLPCGTKQGCRRGFLARRFR